MNLKHLWLVNVKHPPGPLPDDSFTYSSEQKKFINLLLWGLIRPSN